MFPKPVGRLHEKNSFFRFGGDSKMSFHYQTKVSQKGNPFAEGHTFRDMPFFKRRNSE